MTVAGFPDAAAIYVAAGWHPFPLPAGQKEPPPRGLTGADGRIPTADDVESWAVTVPAASNVGVRLARDVVGIDVDDYGDKHGGDTLAALEAEHGELPPTWRSSARGFGVSGIRFFRVPAGVTFPGVLGRAIEIIQFHHRYAVVWPSVNPLTGTTYEWFGPDGQASPPPAIADLPELPAAWVDGLQYRHQATPTPIPSSPTPISGDSIAERINSDFDLHDLIVADGWTLDHQAGAESYWTRPDKARGTSAVLHEPSGPFNVFTSTIDALQQPWAYRDKGPCWSYSTFGYLAATRFGGDRSALAREYRFQVNTQTWVKGTASKAASALSPNPDDWAEVLAELPVVVHNGRQPRDTTRDAIAVLALANEPPRLFVRSGSPTRVRADEGMRPIIETLTKDMVRHRLGEVANWYRVNADGVRTDTPPPDHIVANVLASEGWPFPPLTGIAEVPILRADGTFATAHGYDSGTRLYHWCTTEYPEIPDAPTSDELAAAVAIVDDILADFPFDSTADRANAWGLLLTGIVRPAIEGQVPMGLLDAPEPGTGKSLLARIATLITTGRLGAMQVMPDNEEELKKSITAMLVAGTTTVIFDNVDGVIRSPVLAGALTADVWRDRILGASQTVEIPSRVTWLATGNNISVGGDLARRCYRIRLDARQAQPWRRTGFRHADLEAYVTAHRPQIVAALCTMARAWWTAGKPVDDTLPALGGYTPWVRIVGGILHHAGVVGFLGNLEAFHADADREAIGWEAFLAAWHDTFGDDVLTIGELMKELGDPQGRLGVLSVVEALPDDLAPAWGTSRFSTKLGRALARRAGRHYGVDGLHVVKHGVDRRKVVRYSVSNRPAGVDAEPNARGLNDTPAERDETTRRDVQGAGDAGADHLPRNFLGYPLENENSLQGETAPATPATPALDEAAIEEFWGSP